ncbi:hypothetical protein [Streptomyces sp. NPDC047043]|uniref:hypothetical protein n=1 Tax=Streptomyces sp. NPDC047043 TaxID=3154497 RepID=UPI003406E7D3
MARAVLALGAALLTAAGCVWYVPALADLRAGADRPDSRRTAAAACLAGWTTLAGIAVLLFVGVGWQTACVMAVAGTTVTAALRIRSAAQRRHEVRETVRHWAALNQHDRSHEFSQRAVAGLLACGLVTAVVTAAVAVTAESEGSRSWALAAAPAAIIVMALAVAITYARTARRRITSARARPQ